MANFGDLVVRLTLDKTRFDRGVGAVRGSLQGLTSGIAPLIGGATAIAGMFTAAGFALYSFIKPSFEALDALGNVSDRLGIATDKLGGLQHAAALADVDTETLTTALTKFSDTLSNAANGSKTASKVFNDLGLDAKALKDLSLDEQFVAIADAIAGIKNPADRVRVSMDLFGRSGAQMLQMMQRGGAGIRDAFREAQRLGLAPSESDVARIQEADDAIVSMKEAWRGLGNVLAIEIAPAIELVGKALTASIGVGIPLLKGLMDVLIVDLTKVLRVAQGIAGAFANVPGIGGQFGAIGQAIDVAIAGINRLVGADVGGAGGGAGAGGIAGAGALEKLKPIEPPGGPLRGSKEFFDRLLGAREDPTKKAQLQAQKQAVFNLEAIRHDIQRVVNKLMANPPVGGATIGLFPP